MATTNLTNIKFNPETTKISLLMIFIIAIICLTLSILWSQQLVSIGNSCMVSGFQTEISSGFGWGSVKCFK